MAQQKKTNQSQGLTTSVTTPIPYNWKDHPVVVAAMAVTGTIALAVLLVKEVILPTYTVSLTNQVTSLSAEVSSLRSSKEDAENKLSHLQTQVGELERKLSQAQHANLFVFGSPYPTGLGQIKVGDPISSLDNIYPTTLIEKQENSYWSINDQHKIFNRITYYYDEKLPQHPITHILFNIGYPITIDNAFLQSKLIEVLGVPKRWQSKGYYSWNTQAKVNVYKSDESSFMVMDEGARPGYWPDE